MLIHTSHLTKRFIMGDTVVNALQDVSVDIEQGEFVAIMGPSGSGKSTFMNMIGCLDKPTSGSYDIAGQDVADLSPQALAVTRNQRIGFVFQQFNLLARSTALDNVMLPLLYSQVPHREHRTRAVQRLTQVGLGERLDHKPAQLSGGQQQRVAIARALVNNPALLLADEPTGALDSRTSLEVMALFQSLHAMGQTVIIVTHEPDVAEFASRTIYFKDGRIVQDNAHVPKDAAYALAQLEVHV